MTKQSLSDFISLLSKVHNDLSTASVVAEGFKPLCYDCEEYFEAMEELRMARRRLSNALMSLEITRDELP